MALSISSFVQPYDGYESFWKFNTFTLHVSPDVLNPELSHRGDLDNHLAMMEIHIDRLLTGNQLSGSLSDQLGYLPNLRIFEMVENQLSRGMLIPYYL
ncbi:hypothetical protein KY289_035588 [Solanum tuberosum]|nr:hypothetical protein KY289_035588 [Solanum tuberosum]